MISRTFLTACVLFATACNLAYVPMPHVPIMRRRAKQSEGTLGLEKGIDRGGNMGFFDGVNVIRNGV